jgi:chromosome segregation ATPase
MFESFTDTEVLKKIDDTVREHEQKKQKIIDLTYQIDSLTSELDKLEEQYVLLISELNKRKENVLR